MPPTDPVEAEDSDDTGDDLTYGLSGTDAASFGIDTATGQLKTKEGVTYNHEVKDTYSVKVTVSDGKDAAGDPDTAVDDTITVTITVMDVNEPPTFTTADGVVIEVKENTVSNANIGDPVVATDPDTKATIENTSWKTLDLRFRDRG